MVSASDFAITYCANPGRPDSQATVTGTVARAAGPFAKGDQMSLLFKARNSAHATEAILVDHKTKRRMPLIGSFDKGSVVQITTP